MHLLVCELQDTPCSGREDIRVKGGGAPLILYLGYIWR